MKLFKKINSCDGIYKNSIDIRFTKACDNACAFCIEDIEGTDSFGKTQVENMIKSVIHLANTQGKDTVLILGGEPFLQPKKLLQFIKGIREVIPHIYLTTSLPKEIITIDPVVVEILSNLEGLNVSLHHYTNEKNEEVLKSKRPHDRIALLQQLGAVCGDKIRLQINLVKGFIETRNDLTRMVQLATDFKIKSIKFNELQSVDKDQYISFDALFPEAKLGQPFSGGCQNNITKLFSRPDSGMNIVIKRSCFLVQKNSPKEASLLDLLKVIGRRFFIKKKHRGAVVYENGLQREGWLLNENLIIKAKV